MLEEIFLTSESSFNSDESMATISECINKSESRKSNFKSHELDNMKMFDDIKDKNESDESFFSAKSSFGSNESCMFEDCKDTVEINPWSSTDSDLSLDYEEVRSLSNKYETIKWYPSNFEKLFHTNSKSNSIENLYNLGSPCAFKELTPPIPKYCFLKEFLDELEIGSNSSIESNLKPYDQINTNLGSRPDNNYKLKFQKDFVELESFISNEPVTSKKDCCNVEACVHKIEKNYCFNEKLYELFPSNFEKIIKIDKFKTKNSKLRIIDNCEKNLGNLLETNYSSSKKTVKYYDIFGKDVEKMFNFGSILE